MAVSELKLIKNCAEFLTKDDIKNIPPLTRGIYALLRYRKKLHMYDVVYIGMVGGTKGAGIRGRLRVHKRKKGNLWTHCSIFEVWDNIREEEVRELEGILRHIFRKDSHANKLGIQRSFKKLSKARRESQKKGWMNLSS